jgi:hypothetical protein
MKILGVSESENKIIVVASETCESEASQLGNASITWNGQAYEGYTQVGDAHYDEGNGLTTIELSKPPGIETLRAMKLKEIGAACSQAIYAGITVEGKNYSLAEHDQMEIASQSIAVKNGAENAPYHADGELCRLFPADEFAAIANAANVHIFWHRVYCNHLNAWIRRAETAKEIKAIAYTGNIGELPEDLAEAIGRLL